MNVCSVRNVVCRSWDSSCGCIGCHINQHVNWSICISAHVETLKRVTAFFNQSWYTTRHRCKKQVSRKWHHLLLPNTNKFSEAQPAGLAMFLVLWYMNITFTDYLQEGLPPPLPNHYTEYNLIPPIHFQSHMVFLALKRIFWFKVDRLCWNST
jgi:hypothetical protein